MQLVEKLIGDLLLRHNCVIVPSFGGFVAQRVGARLDEKNGILYPAGKSVLFNKQLINNDGLLIASLSHEMKCNFSDAHKEVNETVEAWEKLLKAGERISIDRVGFLYRDTELNLCFEQDKFYNLLLESFGMGAIHFVSAEDASAAETQKAIQTVIRETEAPIVSLNGKIEAIPVESPVPVFDMVERKKSARWKYAAAAVAIPLTFYSIWIPVKTDVLQSGMISLEDFNPFHKSKPLDFIPTKKTITPVPQSAAQLQNVPDGETFSLQIDENTYVPVRLHESVNSAIETTAASPEPSTVSQHSKIIVGCFSNAENAARLAAELRSKGFDASVMPAGNMTRVSAGNGEDFDRLLPKLRNEGLEAWVLK